MEKIFYPNRNKKVCEAILTSEEIGLKTKLITKDKEKLYNHKGMNTRGILHWIYTHPNTGVSKTNPNWDKWRSHNNTITVGDFNTPLTSMDRSSKHKISKKTLALYDTIDQLDLIDIYRTFLLQATEVNETET